LRAYRARASERILGKRWRTLIEGLPLKSRAPQDERRAV
jgi:hypothetical protein